LPSKYLPASRWLAGDHFTHWIANSVVGRVRNKNTDGGRYRLLQKHFLRYGVSNPDLPIDFGDHGTGA
jgi:hypothetical protein